MNKFFLAFGITLLCLQAPAESLLDKAKLTVTATKCALKHTQTMCIVQLLFKEKKTLLKNEQEVKGRSDRYFVVVPNDNWYRTIGAGKMKDDLMVIDKTARSLITFNWIESAADNYHEKAKEPLLELAEKINVKLEPIPVEVWPFEENGAFYELCYVTDRKTEECMYSAAAEMPGGMIHMFSMVAYDDALIEDVVSIMLSIDVPANE